MANFKMDGLDEFMKALNEIGNSAEEIAKKAVNEAAPKLEAAMSKNIASSANRGYATGELAGSVKAGKAKTNNYGVYAAVTIRGTDSKGVRNGEKAAYLEYGTGKQAAHPFMAKSVREAEPSCQQVMEQVFEQEVNALL